MILHSYSTGYSNPNGIFISVSLYIAESKISNKKENQFWQSSFKFSDAYGEGNAAVKDRSTNQISDVYLDKPM